MLLLDGKALADRILAQAKAKLQAVRFERAPGLAVVLVGARPDSERYVAMKTKAAVRVGVNASFGVTLDARASESDIVQAVQRLNDNPAVDSVLVQLPLPAHVNQERVLRAIRAEKDVDGFHPVNMGQLARWGELTRRHQATGPLAFNVPCTPRGVIALLDEYKIPMRGKRAVVLGRSNIVGLPMALMLMHRDATVTVAHSRSSDVEAITREADIVIAAMGRPHAVRASWVKPGATVVDVGISVGADGKLAGDVDFAAVANVAGALTPVPGGVGPLTVAMLIEGCVESYLRFTSSSPPSPAV